MRWLMTVEQVGDEVGRQGEVDLFVPSGLWCKVLSYEPA